MTECHAERMTGRILDLGLAQISPTRKREKKLDVEVLWRPFSWDTEVFAGVFTP